MGRKSRSKGSATQAPARTSQTKAVVLAAVGLAVASWHSDPPSPLWQPAPPPAPLKEAPPASPGPGAAPPSGNVSATPEEYRALVGQWVRPDGGYVLAVRSVTAEGVADAGYFNPRPIKVGEAEARRKGDSLELFVKLQDRNYPGSTYTLKYDPRSDQMVGVYYQAVQRASYDVVFVRR